jgi:hypothetical protein
MVATIQKEGMEITRFQEITQANANPDVEMDASQEEMMLFKQLSTKLKSIQNSFQAEVAEIIKSEGMTIEKYQEVYAALQSDESLQEKFSEIMNG